MAMYATTVVPGFEHFNDKHIASGKVTFDTLLCRGVGVCIAEPDRNNKTVADQPVQVIGIKDFILVLDLPQDRIADYVKACCRDRIGSSALGIAFP